MIVEDEEDILTLYSDYLSKRGYHVMHDILEETTLRQILKDIRRMSF